MVINTIERESTRSGAPTDRAAREAATRDLMERRAASTDEVERQEILEQVVELNLEMAKGIARRFRGRGAEADAELTLADVVADDEDASIDQLETVEMLQPVLADLGERDRRILQLRFVEGWTQSEIGEDIGVSQMQVSRVLRRILDDLRKKLTPLQAAA